MNMTLTEIGKAKLAQSLSRDEHHLLDWLAKEETSLVGECKGAALDMLIGSGLAGIVTRDARGRDYDRVALTGPGQQMAKYMGPWEPQP